MLHEKQYMADTVSAGDEQKLGALKRFLGSSGRKTGLEMVDVLEGRESQDSLSWVWFKWQNMCK